MRIESIRDVVEPVVATLGLDLYDLALEGHRTAPLVRVTVDRDGGVDLDAVTAATEAVSGALDAADLGGGPYGLEITSPGLERRLRTSAQYRGAVGATVSVKTRTDGEAVRQHGVLTAVDESSITIDADGRCERIPLDSVVAARTVFEWGAAPGPAGPKRRAKKKKAGAR